MTTEKPLKGKKSKDAKSKDRKWSKFSNFTLFAVFSERPLKRPYTEEEMVYGLCSEVNKEKIFQCLQALGMRLNKLISEDK